MPLIPTQEPPYYEINDSPDPSGKKTLIGYLSQDAGLTYTLRELYNTIGSYTVTKNGDNTAKINKTAAFTQKTTTPPFANWLGSDSSIIPITDGAAITGYYGISYTTDTVWIDFKDETFMGESQYTIMGSTEIYIEINIYP